MTTTWISIILILPSSHTSRTPSMQIIGSAPLSKSSHLSGVRIMRGLSSQLSVNSHATIIFFYSGASHSFIKRSYAFHHELKVCTSITSYLIEAPGAKILTEQFVQMILILINGVTFFANLLVIDTKGLDIILGMNWLTKNNIIDCA